MTTTIVTRGVDTWLGSADPREPHGDDKALRVATGAAYAYVQLQSPAPAGATIQSATLTLTARGASSGARTLIARLVTAEWKARRQVWTSRPAVADGAGASATVGSLPSGATVSFDVTADVAAIQAGAPPYGWRIETSGSEHRFHSFEAGALAPTLSVTYTMAPAKPTSLRPSGGPVGVAQPTLQWKAQDQASYRVQVDAAADGVSPDYDSGPVAVAVAEHRLSGTVLNLADGATTKWRVRVTNAAGESSPWSDWATISRDTKGALTITSPAAAPNDVVWEPTPPILFALTGETLEAFEVVVTPAVDRSKRLHASGRVPAAAGGAYTLPELADDGTRLIVGGVEYSVGVLAYDDKQRQGSSAAGDEPYVIAWRDFRMTEDDGVTAPGNLTVSQVPNEPAARLRFTRGAVPDGLVILRDGVELAVLEPSAAFTGGVRYEWVDATVQPGVRHEYSVRAIEDGRQSPASAAASLIDGVSIEGTWLYDPTSGRYVVLSGVGTNDWRQVEIGTTYVPLGARAGFRITQVLGGLAGTFDGLLRERSWRSVEDMVADFWVLKAEAPHTTLRLVADRMNIPVQAYELVCAVPEESNEDYLRRRVTFGFYQVGEYEFGGLV